MAWEKLLRRTSLHEVVIALALISAVLLQLKNFADDPGVGWHLETGAWILSNHSIPTHDPFLATPLSTSAHSERGEPARTPARVWISDQWLSDIALSLLYDTGSWALVYAALTSVYLLTYFLVLYGGVRGLGAPALAATFAVMCAFKAGQIHFILRPVMFSFLFFSIVYVACLRDELEALKQPSTGARTSHLWHWPFRYGAWVLFFALWANMHPGFILGLGIVGLSVGVTCARALLNSSFRPRVPGALLFLVCCVLGTIVNPYGLALHESIFSLRASDYFMHLHQEWMPITFDSPEGRLWILTVFLVGVTTPFVIRRERSITALGATFVLGLSCFDAVRMMPFFGIVAAYPLAIGIGSLGQCSFVDRSRVFARLKRAFGFFESREQSVRSGKGLLTTICIALILSSVLRSDLIVFFGPFGPSSAKFPYGAVEFLQNSGREGIRSSSQRPIVVASIPEWGGFLTLFARNVVRPMMDDRNTLIGESFHRRYSANLDGVPGWSRFFHDIGADALLLPVSTSLAKVIAEEPASGWHVVYRDAQALIAIPGPT